MDTMKICSGCQKPLAPNAPDGLCPACLIKAGLGTGVDIGPDSQAQCGPSGFVAPTPAELVKPFPQLEILSFIGQGGMGAVYRARQKELDRVVALKILPPGIGKDPAFAQRFAREAMALAKLNHPGIVTLYEFGQADGLFYFLMEFVDGVNLRHLLEAGRVSPREALAIVPQICDALQYAHDQGIVHRDIKPANILLDRRGRVKVADFGLAKLVGTEGEPSAAGGVVAASVVLTEAGKVMGTPQYMAPEQRDHPAKVDHRADIYSLGVVFYEMLTGELPGKRIEPPSRRVQVDVRIDEIVMRALEKTPALRYQTAADLRMQIDTAINDAIPARPGNPTGNSAARLLKGGASFITTPEQLRTFDGQFFLFRRRGQLILDDRQLTVSRAGAFTVIPLAAIRDLSIGRYPRTMHPMGLDFISVTYDEEGRTQRLFLSPYESWIGLPSNFNRIVAEWFAAMRAAVVAATGCEPGNTPAEQLGVPSGSKAIYASLLVLVVFGGSLFLGLTGMHPKPPPPLVVPTMPRIAVPTSVPAEAHRRNEVLEVWREGPKAFIQAELDDAHELRLFVGTESLGWSSQHTGSTSVTATVEASSQIKMEDGSMGRGLIFQAWGSRHYIALTPEGSVPFGEVVFRDKSQITNENGTFTFADIRQTNGTLIPVSVRVRPVSGNSMFGGMSGPARGFDGGMGGGMGRAAGGFGNRPGGGMSGPVADTAAYVRTQPAPSGVQGGSNLLWSTNATVRSWLGTNVPAGNSRK